jgi:TRAP-type C4-dicarboxylate transport system substrate-binding protein
LITALATAPLCSGLFVTRARAAEFVFKVAHPLAATHPTNVRLKEAADAIAKDSDGRIELRIFPNNQLGGEVDLLNQVRSGAVEMYVIGGLVVSSVVPAAALDGTGFAFKDYSRVWPAADGKLGAYIRAALMQANLYATERPWDLGFREITSSVRPIKSVDDIRGMKIRVPGAAAYADLFKALGAAPDKHPVQRSLSCTADQARRRSGEPTWIDRHVEILRSAEVLLAQQPHLARKLDTD